MSDHSEIPRCQHIKINGVQCGSPALSHNRHCYFHHAWRKTHRPRRPSASSAGVAFNLPVLEDANSIQMAIAQVMRLILTREIDGKIAGLLLYALQTAATNLKRLTPEPEWNRIVVNPSAVRYSQFVAPRDQTTLKQENKLLEACASKGSDTPSPEPRANTAVPPPSEPERPRATLDPTRVQRSRHSLPTSREEWDELKRNDFDAWLMSAPHVMLSPNLDELPPDEQAKLRREQQIAIEVEKQMQFGEGEGSEIANYLLSEEGGEEAIRAVLRMGVEDTIDGVPVERDSASCPWVP